MLNHDLLAALVPLSKKREAVLQVPGAHANMSPMPNLCLTKGPCRGRQEDAWIREDNKMRTVDYDSHHGVARDPVTRDVIS